MMKNTSSIFNKDIFINTPPPFDSERFHSWKAKMKFFVEANDFEIWVVISGPFLFLLIV